MSKKEELCYICGRDIMSDENYFVRYDGEFGHEAPCICMDCVNKLEDGETEMRYCVICGKPMHTSWNGFWLKKKRYQAHVPCEKKVIEDALQKAIDENENNNKN